MAATEAMVSGFICTRPWPIIAAALPAPVSLGTLPSKVDRPVFQSRPMPKTSFATPGTAPSGMSFASEMKAVLQEAAKSWAKVAPGFAAPSTLWNFIPYVSYFGQGSALPGDALPCSSRVAAVMTFIVEPGAVCPISAGLNAVFLELAIARISPVLGCTATTEASFCPFTAFSAAPWAAASRVVWSLPGFPLETVKRTGPGVCWPSGSIDTSTPASPPVLSPNFWRSWGSTATSDG